jgi:hypothetical protein
MAHRDTARDLRIADVAERAAALERQLATMRVALAELGATMAETRAAITLIGNYLKDAALTAELDER